MSQRIAFSLFIRFIIAQNTWATIDSRAFYLNIM